MNAPLTIAMPIHSFEPGGVERTGLNLARSWQDAGHAVTVVLGRDAGPDRAQAPELRYVTRRGGVHTAGFETIWMIWCLFVYLRRHHADVLFCPGNTYAVVCVAMRLLLGAQCAPIVAKMSNDLVRADKAWPNRLSYRAWLIVQGLLFDRFVAMAPPMRDEIARCVSVAAHRIAVIPDPALTSERLHRLLAIRRTGSRGPILRFIAVGRLVPQKNFAMMINAFARGSRAGDTLTIVGDGPQRRELEALVRRLSLQRHVHFAGHVASPDALLARADCLLLSSVYEGVPAVVIEAIAAGLPVIATDCATSMAELTGSGTRGALVPPGDIAVFANWITEALSLPEPTTAGRHYAAAFVIEEARDRYIALVHEAIGAEHEYRMRYLPSAMR